MKVNQNLEEEFNLSPLESEEKEEVALEVAQGPSSIELYEKLDKINAALPIVSGLDTATDKELDDLAEYGLTAHKELMELAMNIEQRFIGEVSASAANMLGHAIDAKTNKIKKKLKMVELQIKKQIADQKVSNDEVPEDLTGEHTVLDRNELLTRLLGKNSVK
jgi:hypothetical protein